MPKKLALLKQKMKKNCIPSAKNKKDLHSQCQIKKNLHSQYQKLKNIVVFEKFGHVTYLQICKFKNLQIYDVLNELDIWLVIVVNPGRFTTILRQKSTALTNTR